jgi:hypothetical protein
MLHARCAAQLGTQRTGSSLMIRLICCEGCSRHVRTSELLCPFCQRKQTPTPESPTMNVPAGLSRAQRLALAAAMAGQALASCAKTNEPIKVVMPVYGAPLAGNVAPSAGRGTPAAGSGAAGRDVMIIPPYGLPPPPPPAGRAAPPIAGHASDSEDGGANDQDAGSPKAPR